eukprot:scaffold199696_cov26-Tisochrysis_lutea.AAC.1
MEKKTNGGTDTATVNFRQCCGGVVLAYSWPHRCAPMPALMCFRTLPPCTRALKDFQAHLGMSNTQAPSHIWLPKHRMYLRGDQVRVTLYVCKSAYVVQQVFYSTR